VFAPIQKEDKQFFLLQIDFYQNLATISTKNIDHYNRKQFTWLLATINQQQIIIFFGHVHQQLTQFQQKN
jgi:hypothetical protein